jgi:hypothetical protein
MHRIVAAATAQGKQRVVRVVSVDVVRAPERKRDGEDRR